MLNLKIALQYLMQIIVWAIIIKTVLSWFPGAQDSKIYQILDEFTHPIEGNVRRVFGRYMNGILDFTPVIAIVFLSILGHLIERFL